MKATLVTIIFLVVSLVFCPGSFAAECYTDLDCTMGNRCLKLADDAKGICLEGSQLPNLAPRQSPISDRPQRDTKGKMCWSSKDCEPGLECIMKSGQMSGICR
jgi:hypothetical protein